MLWRRWIDRSDIEANKVWVSLVLLLYIQKCKQIMLKDMFAVFKFANGAWVNNMILPDDFTRSFFYAKRRSREDSQKINPHENFWIFIQYCIHL